MSTKVTVNQSKSVKVIGLITVIVGVIMFIAGAFAYGLVGSYLKDEKITVSSDASWLADKEVAGPFTAFSQADIINKHALDATGGKTYAELPREDPLRDTAMSASFLRASLFTSVVSFGVAALVMAVGVLFGLVGWALVKVSGGPSVVTESTAPAPMQPGPEQV
ncbi:aromatic ring-opening dioxygenase LigA [Timonella sp. A28]|uniref:aromatic ring-opening dioxygenase LigA n=1 Tax=Timonella sp. A28 TaxID=3442640 RepID=UPI003EBD5CFB